MAETAQREEWLRRVRAGDRLAAAKLLAHHHPMLAAKVASLMDRTLRLKLEPEDILQEVYLAVYRQLAGYDGSDEAEFVAWVLTIARSKVIDAKRRLRRRRRDVAREVRPDAVARSESYWNLLDQLYAESGTPSRVIRREEAVSALLASLGQLSEAHRRVIQLRFIEGKSVADAAASLGKSEGAVVMLTARALEALRQWMNRMGEFTRIT